MAYVENLKQVTSIQYYRLAFLKSWRVYAKLLETMERVLGVAVIYLVVLGYLHYYPTSDCKVDEGKTFSVSAHRLRTYHMVKVPCLDSYLKQLVFGLSHVCRLVGCTVLSSHPSAFLEICTCSDFPSVLPPGVLCFKCVCVYNINWN